MVFQTEFVFVLESQLSLFGLIYLPQHVVNTLKIYLKLQKMNIKIAELRTLKIQEIKLPFIHIKAYNTSNTKHGGILPKL